MILKYCRDVDPKGTRTLGIITKPDFLEKDSETERSFFELARNEDIKFYLGWHMLKNLKDGAGSDFEVRNQAECDFFSQGNYRTLDDKTLGIEHLRSRLSSLLQRHLKKELPSLKKEVDQMLSKSSQDLAQLGVKRATTMEQRHYLMDISKRAHDIIVDAIRGIYERAFFGLVDTHLPIDSESNLCRLRASVQCLNMKFAKRMRCRGRKYAISQGLKITNAGPSSSGSPSSDTEKYYSD